MSLNYSYLCLSPLNRENWYSLRWCRIPALCLSISEQNKFDIAVHVSRSRFSDFVVCSESTALSFLFVLFLIGSNKRAANSIKFLIQLSPLKQHFSFCSCLAPSHSRTTTFCFHWLLNGCHHHFQIYFIFKSTFFFVFKVTLHLLLLCASQQITLHKIILKVSATLFLSFPLLPSLLLPLLVQLPPTANLACFALGCCPFHFTSALHIHFGSTCSFEISSLVTHSSFSFCCTARAVCQDSSFQFDSEFAFKLRYPRSFSPTEQIQLVVFLFAQRPASGRSSSTNLDRKLISSLPQPKVQLSRPRLHSCFSLSPKFTRRLKSQLKTSWTRSMTLHN